MEIECSRQLKVHTYDWDGQRLALLELLTEPIMTLDTHLATCRPECLSMMTPLSSAMVAM